MAAADCIKQMLDAAGGKLTSDDLDELITQAKAQRKLLENQATTEGVTDDALNAAVTVGARKRMEAMLKKREAYLNYLVDQRFSQFTDQFKPTARQQWEAFAGKISGSMWLKGGSRQSAVAAQNEFEGRWLGGMMNDLETIGLRTTFLDNSYGRETALALEAIGAKNESGLKDLPKDAVAIAKIVDKWQEASRIERNRYGAYIGKMSDWVTRHSHDMFKIKEAGFEKWRADIEPRLDFNRIEKDWIENGYEGQLDRDEFFRSLWGDFASGVHLRNSSANMTGVGGNLAKRESQHRVLHFKEGEWFDYNAKYGVGALSDAVVGGLHRSAQAAGLMKELGTNPEKTLDDMILRTLQRLPVDERGEFNSKYVPMIKDLLAHADRSTEIPASNMLARAGSLARIWQSMSKLGGSVISSFNDLVTYGADVAYTQDRNIFSGIGEALKGVGGSSAAEKRLLRSMGLWFDHVSQGAMARFDADDATGKTASWLMQKYFMFNLQTPWTNTLRHANILSASNYIAQHSGMKFASLPDGMKRTMTLYNIDEGKWDLIRATKKEAADGNEYIVPEAMRELTDDALTDYLTKVGTPVTKRSLETLRSEMEGVVRNLYVDRAHIAIVEPDARTRRVWVQGTQAGTGVGELARMIAQFKGFPTALMQKQVSREVYGYGDESLKQAMTSGSGALTGLAQLMVGLTAFGYASMTAKDLLRGREPRDPKDFKTFAAAFLQGGAAGIYGDVLLGESNRYGRNLTATLAGPVLGTINDADQLRAILMYSEDDTERKSAAKALRLIYNNTPFQNLFYTKTAMDYLFIYGLQESITPGYLRRMERDMERHNNQGWVFRPSEYAVRY